MNLDCLARWHAAHTHPHGEPKAAAHLRRQDFNVYLPRYLKRRQHARGIKIVPATLFPRYLFVNIDMATQRWRTIQSTIGVAHGTILCDAYGFLICPGATQAVSEYLSGKPEAMVALPDGSGFLIKGLSTSRHGALQIQ